MTARSRAWPAALSLRFVVELYPGRWLTSEPGSTGKLHHAERHTSYRAAEVALIAARKHRPLRQAEIREMR